MTGDNRYNRGHREAGGQIRRKDTLVKSHRSRRVAAVAAIALTSTLAGCAEFGSDPSAAAVVDGRAISETDVQTVVEELTQLQLPQQIGADRVTQYLAIGPTVRETFTEAGLPVGESQVRQGLADPDAALSEPTLDVLTTLKTVDVLQEAKSVLQAPGAPPAQMQVAQRAAVAEQMVNKRVSEQMKNGQLVFNPKYLRAPENWIQQAAPEMAGQAPQG